MAEKDTKVDKKQEDTKLSQLRKDPDLISKAQALLKKHPEIQSNARGYFRNENGKTIVEETVARGDAGPDSVHPVNQEELSEKDFKAIAAHAKTLIDDQLSQYDKDVAMEGALQMAIGSMDEGKYSGKINASTFALILGEMKGDKTPAKEPKSQLDNKEKVEKKEKNAATAAVSVTTEDNMDKVAAMKEIDALKAKIASLEQVVNAPESKVEEPKVATEETPSTLKEIIASVEDIATDLEKSGKNDLIKVAFELDKVCDMLEGKKPAEKQASIYKQDADEGFMKGHFQAGVIKQDSDEPYTKEYNTDCSTQVIALRKGKTNLPYMIKA
jgi:hypothetical protein